jgi:hypothetical protein
MTHVHSPDPNLIGCEVIWGGAPSAAVFDVRLHGLDVLLDAVGRGLSLPVHEDIVGVMVSEDAGPVGVVPSHDVEFIHALKVAINCVVVRHIQSASCAIESSTSHAQGIPEGRDAAPAPEHRVRVVTALPIQGQS